MQRLLVVLFELHEARRYIEDRRLPHLRLALLLLDNAAEIQMDSRIRQIWGRNETREHIREIALSLPQQDLPDNLREFTGWMPLSRSRKNKIERYFDEKVAYLVGQGDLDERISGPLKYLHKYRNEAYHRAKIRSETIRTAALILLEINCLMVTKLARRAIAYSSNEDYSWFQERFGYNRNQLYSCHEDLPIIVDEIRSRVLPTEAAVADTLATHLRNRFADLDDNLTLIVENMNLGTGKELALGASQFYAEVERTGGQPPPEALKAFVPKYTLQSIRDLEAQAVQVGTAATRLEAFQRFSHIENDLEPIELCVGRMAQAVDLAIQQELDRRRGK
jgi:hypothetical protein